MKVNLVLASVAALLLLALPAAAAGVTQPVMTGDLGIHDPTMIVVDHQYVAFYTGPEHGLAQGAILIKTSPDGLAWKNAGALGKGIPAWVQPTLGFKPPNLWAPTVSHHGGMYYLYYAASLFGLQISGIGMMTNPALDPAHPASGWTDQGMVLKSGTSDTFNAIDPFRIDTADGRAWLSFGSYWDGIKLRELDPVTGLLKSGAETFGLATRFGGAIEASSILAHGGHYYLFVSYDRCCAGVSSTYRIMVGRADAITGPYLDDDGRPMLKGYARQVQRTEGRFIGPGGEEVFTGPGGEDLLVYHYYDGDSLGASKLEVAPLRWTDDGWPTLDPLPGISP